MTADRTDATLDRWPRAFVQNQQSLRAWLFVMLVLSAGRVVYLFALRSYWPVEYSSTDLIRIFGRGLRFDCVTATYVSLLPILLASLGVAWPRAADWADRVGQFAVGIFLVAAPALLFGSIGYYREYLDSFNPFMFEFFYDDTVSILRIMQGEHALGQKFLASIAISAAAWVLYRRWFRRPYLEDATSAAWMSTWRGRVAVSLAVVLSLVLGLRCSLGSRPLQAADAGVTTDRFFNKATMNPVYTFQCAAVDRLKEKKFGPKIQISDDQVAEAVQSAFFNPVVSSENLPSTPDRAAGEPLFQVAKGPRAQPPDHIFVIIMESYDAWPLLDRYRSLGAVENGRRLAEQGLHVKAFLPSTDNSLGSYLSITSGLHHTSRYRQRAFATSLPGVFNELGYATRLFVGDSATWQHIEDLATQGGFSEFYAAGAIVTTSSLGCQPRAHDPELFAFVRRQLRHAKKSINVIRTVSNHGPYEVDLESQGCVIPDLSDDLKSMCNRDKRQILLRLGHLKFSDKCLGRFIEQVEAEYPDSLFVITGDHYGRDFLNNQPTMFEGACVPLILYGKKALAGLALPPRVAGSHMDITPTLVNMVAPQGFRFASIGSDLLTPRQEFLGVSDKFVIGADFIASFGETSLIEPLPWTTADSPEYLRASARLPHIQRVFAAVQGLSSWILRQQDLVSSHNQGAAAPR